MRIFILISVFVIPVFWASHASGLVIIVKADGSGDQPDIQTAVAASSPGDSVCLVDPLYLGEGNRNISFMGKPLTVYSLSGDPDSCIIDCEWDSDSEPPYPDLLGFLFTAGEDSNSVISGLTVRNCYKGIIRCENSSPRIDNCIFTLCDNGFGIECYNSSPNITSTTISHCRVQYGGVYLSTNSSPRLTDCVISGNVGADCIGKLGCHGAGIICEDNSNPVLTRCLITDNVNWQANGAGMSCYDSSPVIVDCVFSFNRIANVYFPDSSVYGSALDCWNAAPVLIGCQFFGNSSFGGKSLSPHGGSIAFRGGSRATMTGCTIVGNKASTDFGGIFISNSSLEASGTVIAFNDHEALIAEPPTTILLSCCNIYGNSGGDWIGPISSQLGIDGNISEDPRFCDAASYELTLRADSPCLDANHPTGTGCGRMGALGLGCFLQGPHITGVMDVGNDQGRQVRLAWDRSEYDAPGSPDPITGYGIFRRQDEFFAKDPTGQYGDKLGGWDFLDVVPARGDDLYQCIAPTLSDSTINQGISWSVFMVSAMTSQPLVYFDSAPDSGYSLDNLSPGVPANIQAAYHATGTDLDWDDSTEEDFLHYRVYRGPDPGFTPTAEKVIYETTVSDFTDHTGDPWDYYYKITTIDQAGNESEPGAPGAISGISGNTVPSRSALFDPVPNPFNASTMLAFEVETAGNVTLKIFDAAGRLVATLLDRHQEPGPDRVIWDGRDTDGRFVAAGVYIYRIEAGGYSEAKRMVMVK